MLLCVDFDQINNIVQEKSSCGSKCSLVSAWKRPYKYSSGLSERYLINIDMEGETRDTISKVCDALEELSIFREDCFGKKACTIRYDMVVSDSSLNLDLDNTDIILKDGKVVYMYGFDIPKYENVEEGLRDIRDKVGKVLNLMGDGRDAISAVLLPIHEATRSKEHVLVPVNLSFGTIEEAKKFLELAVKQDLRFMSDLSQPFSEGERVQLVGYFLVYL